MGDSSHPRNPQKKPRLRPWEIEYVQSHPEMTAREVSQGLPGRTPHAVEQIRSRYGRWPGSARSLCVECDERVVWAESPRARKMRLCKGCYLREMEMRESERLRANALRQRIYKSRRQGGASGVGESPHGEDGRTPGQPQA